MHGNKTINLILNIFSPNQYSPQNAYHLLMEYGGISCITSTIQHLSMTLQLIIEPDCPPSMQSIWRKGVMYMVKTNNHKGKVCSKSLYRRKEILW